MIFKAVLCWTFVTIVTTQRLRDTNEKIDYRLPQHVLPKHYELYLWPDVATGNFTGQEIITLEVQASTSQIVLHSHKISIESVFVQDLDGWMVGNSRKVESYELDTVRQFLIINLVEELQKDSTITLSIIFEGQMQDKIVGLYSSTYLTPQQEHRTIATTKFEPTYARQAFPCFDEPAIKATYNITVVHPTSEYHALSNMDQMDSVYLGEYTEAHFATSVPMSSYLVCIIVSDLEHETKEINTQGIGNNFNLRVFATPHQKHKVNFALDTAAAITEYYIQYYKVPYPLPKLDMAAIPDFASNAMENWGLVSYRETALLYDEEYSSTWNKQSTASVIAHELVHMWFGNLVTMKWWNDLWLNEGFARYMQYKGVNAVYSDWGMNDQFLIHALHSVLVFDAKVSSHPIVQTVENPDQITEIFDTITYDKGGSVIRMLENYVGADKFENAVTSYLEKFKYDNAVTDDFLTEVAQTGLDFDVKLMMRTWTEQMGFPVVEVARTSANSFEITQKRFFSNIADYDAQYEDSEFKYTWTIPLTFILDTSSTASSLLFEYDDAKVEIAVSTETKWLKLNMHQVGFYRVNYDINSWAAIIDVLMDTPSRFDIADRAHLLNDAFALADAGQLSYGIALNMTAYLAKELDFVPWYVASRNLQGLQNRLMYVAAYVDLLTYSRNLLAQVYDSVTWAATETDHLKNRLRVTVLTAACAAGLPDCLKEAEQQFNTWLADPSKKPIPDLRQIVYYYGMEAVSDAKTWEKMLQIFHDETDASEKLKLMYGLSAVRDPQLLYRFIQLAEDESYVRRQDYFNCIQNVAANPAGQPIVWDYVRENWPSLVSRFGLNDRYLGRMIPTITKNFATEVKLDEIQRFFALYPDAGAGASSRKQALETVKLNIQWLAQNEVEISNWLSNWNKQTS